MFIEAYKTPHDAPSISVEIDHPADQFSVVQQARGLLELEQAIPGNINFEPIAALALECSDHILAKWLPDGWMEGNEYVACNPMRDDHEPGSFKINTLTGAWADFAVDERGRDLISLVAYLDTCAQAPAARKLLKFVAELDEGTQVTSGSRKAAKRSAKSTSDCTPAMPIPATAGLRPNFFSGLGKPQASWTYTDADGNAMCYVDRFQLPDGGKTIRPLTFCLDQQGRGSWQQRAPSIRPAYGLHKLAQSPSSPVVFTEGEKAADAAQRLFPTFVAVTTLGGAMAPEKTDFTPFAGRAVYLAPDNDEAGERYATKVTEMLRSVNASIVGCLNSELFRSEGTMLPQGWDLADAEKDGWDATRIDGLGTAIWKCKPESVAPQVATTTSTSAFVPGGPVMENVARFVQGHFNGNLVFVQNQFRTYTEGYWPALDRKVDIERPLCDFQGKLATPGSINSMIALMSSAFASHNAQFEELKALMCLLNGTLNPVTGELGRHSKEDCITNRLDLNWSDEATCELWLQTLGEIFEPDADKAEKVTLLQEFMGYCLVPMTDMHKFLWLVGGGGNGKSLILAVLTELVGRANISFAQIERIQDKFVRAELCGKLVNISSEMSAQATVSDGYLKQIVSGDIVEAERKHQPSFSFRPYSRLIGATNELPRLLDGSDGFFRRAMILRFNRKFTEAEQDKGRLDALLNELPGILKWAVAGLQNLLARGNFLIPASSREEANRYRVHSDPVRQFAEECLQQSENRFDYLTPAKLHEHYQAWCRTYGYQAVGVNRLTTRLRDLGIEQYRPGGTKLWKVRFTAPATEDSGEPAPATTSNLAQKYTM